MMKGRLRIALILMVLAVTGCSASSARQIGFVIGGLAGSVGGGLIGQTAIGGPMGALAGAAVGGVIGALIGGSFADAIDASDRPAEDHALQHTLQYAPAGAANYWVNPDTGSRGMITPAGFHQGFGPVCRNFSETYWNPDRPQISRTGTACLYPRDGRFSVQSET